MADDMRPAMSDVETAWRSGVPLSYAWFEFAVEYAREKYRNPKSQASDAQRMMMVADLWARLDNGELLAFGHCTSPEISKGPIPLPTHIFCDRPSIEIGHSDDIAVSGWVYERVRVCHREGLNWVHENGGSQAPKAAKNRLGRPPSLEMFVNAWSALKSEIPNFLNWPKSDQNLEIRNKVAIQNSGKYPGTSKPGDSTVRKHRRERPDLFT